MLLDTDHSKTVSHRNESPCELSSLAPSSSDVHTADKSAKTSVRPLCLQILQFHLFRPQPSTKDWSFARDISPPSNSLHKKDRQNVTRTLCAHLQLLSGFLGTRKPGWCTKHSSVLIKLECWEHNLNAAVAACFLLVTLADVTVLNVVSSVLVHSAK